MLWSRMEEMKGHCFISVPMKDTLHGTQEAQHTFFTIPNAPTFLFLSPLTERKFCNRLTFEPNFTREMLFLGVICQEFFIRNPIALVNLSGVGTKFVNVHLVR